MTKTYDFAGEEVKVTETVPANTSKDTEQVVTKCDDPAKPDSEETKKAQQETKKTKLACCKYTI